ncbi:MAG: hypothetical protein PHS53_03520 [Candidatus Pacebacteria bacterium]|nr:hypothetical protein [Candidatus Paceibacterota bacterium]MDD5357186.1 hypothetical protein [Candidatus Paceibacterota bacterium]
MSESPAVSVDQDVRTQLERLISLFDTFHCVGAIVACASIFVFGIFIWDVSYLVAGIESAFSALVFFVYFLVADIFDERSDDDEEDDLREAVTSYPEEFLRIRSNSFLIGWALLFLIVTCTPIVQEGILASLVGTVACFALGIGFPTRLCTIFWYWGDKKSRWQTIV